MKYNIFIVILALACGGLSLFVSCVQNVYRIFFFFHFPPSWLIIGKDLSGEKAERAARAGERVSWVGPDRHCLISCC